MQLSELFRRGILLARSDEAEEQLSQWRLDSPVPVVFLPFTDDASFERVWETGVFRSINNMCGSCIDDYEEESLAHEHADKVLSILDFQLRSPSDPLLESFMRAFRCMVAEAKLAGRPLYFIF